MRLLSALTVMTILATSAELAAAQVGSVSSKERYAYCATKFSEMRPGWLTNGCHTAPFGRSEYLKPAWDCLCLQR
jgi:hypothetical protein